MSNFNVGDMVYADGWCYGVIVEIGNGYAKIERQTYDGVAYDIFEIDKLSHSR